LSPRQFEVHFTVILDQAYPPVEPYAEVDPESLSVSSQPELNLNNQTERNRAPMVDKPKAPIDIRYGQLGVLQLRLRTTDPGVLLDELTGRFASAPQFFKRAAVCIDLLTVKPFPDLSALGAIMDAVRRAGMIPIGLAGEAAAVEPLAVAVNLPVLSSFRAPTRPVPGMEPAQPEPEPVPDVEPAVAVQAAPGIETRGGATLLHTQMVRSGQRVYARQRDLIVTATVASGAEVMADGCVHVYGSLRGRAIAGAREGTSARIFCQEFHAELVSVAGVFRIFETIPPDLRGKPVQVWLDGENLHCMRIGT
jgi:septum site-determining protein MinC